MPSPPRLPEDVEGVTVQSRGRALLGLLGWGVLLGGVGAAVAAGAGALLISRDLRGVVRGLDWGGLLLVVSAGLVLYGAFQAQGADAQTALRLNRPVPRSALPWPTVIVLFLAGALCFVLERLLLLRLH